MIVSFCNTKQHSSGVHGHAEVAVQTTGGSAHVGGRAVRQDWCGFPLLCRSSRCNLRATGCMAAPLIGCRPTAQPPVVQLCPAPPECLQLSLTHLPALCSLSCNGDVDVCQECGPGTFLQGGKCKP